MENKDKNEDFFVRRTDLEHFFPEIRNDPIVSIKKYSIDKKTKQLTPEYDTNKFTPNILYYCSKKGFYPICFDNYNNKLVFIINKNYHFKTYDGKDETTINTEEAIVSTILNNFDTYFPEFFTGLIPNYYKQKVKTVFDIDFKFVDEDVFDDLIGYVCDVSAIEEYSKQKSIADSKDKGLFAEDNDSIAAGIVDSVLTYAVIHRATDVHFEYTGEKYVARIRIDGDLQLYPKDLPSKYFAALINVIRNKAELDIAEHFKAQDGQMQFDSKFKSYDIRVSIIPDANNRMNAVLRIQQAGEFKTLEHLGFNKKVYDQIKMLCKEPHGMILVTGPTGSGKTTTLFSMLNELNTEDVKILTAEDPPEIKMARITQVAINEKQGRTFPTILRHFLRHDPDIILVGEMRDIETVRLAISAANTGHLVLSTLHTNDAASTIKRLSNMESIDPAEFAFALKGVCSQRLIKIFNPKIIDEFPINHEDRLKYYEKHKLYEIDVGEELNKICGENIFPVGITFGLDGAKDNFVGRTAITEFWKLGSKAQDLIFGGNFSTGMLVDIAINEDEMLPMPITGMEKVVKLETSLDNLVKTVGIDSIKQCKKLIIDMFFRDQGQKI